MIVVEKLCSGCKERFKEYQYPDGHVERTHPIHCGLCKEAYVGILYLCERHHRAYLESVRGLE